MAHDPKTRFEEALEGDAVASAVEVVHGLDGEEDEEFAGCFLFDGSESQAVLSTVGDDLPEDLIDGVLILSGPTCDGFAEMRSGPFQVGGSRGIFAVLLGV